MGIKLFTFVIPFWMGVMIGLLWRVAKFIIEEEKNDK